jgi:hypothetical protein
MLEGYKQVFPSLLNALNERYAKGDLSGASLEKRVEQIEGFAGIGRPTTEDGYCWFWGLYFVTKGVKVAILFPWAQDCARLDGSQADRSIAFYVTGDVDPKEVKAIAENILEVL